MYELTCWLLWKTSSWNSALSSLLFMSLKYNFVEPTRQDGMSTNAKQFAFYHIFDLAWPFLLNQTFRRQRKREEIWGPGIAAIIQSLSCVWLFVTPWTAAHQASLSITNSQSLLKLISIESLMPFNHLVLWHPFLRLPSIFPSIRVFFNELALHSRGPKY